MVGNRKRQTNEKKKEDDAPNLSHYQCVFILLATDVMSSQTSSTNSDGFSMTVVIESDWSQSLSLLSRSENMTTIYWQIPMTV